MERAFQMFGYLKHHLRAKMYFDLQQMNTEGIEFVYDNEWKDIYPDAKEAIGEGVPDANTPEVKITVYKDACRATDLIGIRCVTGIMIFVQSALVKSYSKRQNTVESSTWFRVLSYDIIS